MARRLIRIERTIEQKIVGAACAAIILMGYVWLVRWADAAIFGENDIGHFLAVFWGWLLGLKWMLMLIMGYGETNESEESP